MKKTLKENGGLPLSLLWTMAVVAGVTVANLYYNQPLLHMISSDLGVTEFATNQIAMTTQIGYALGLMFIVPLGDLLPRRLIVITNFTVLVISLMVIANARSIELILVASLLTGMCSIVPQIFIPVAAQYSTPDKKGRNVGIVVSGLLSGILISRVVSGVVGEFIGWRFMFMMAAALMVICAVIMLRVLPDMKANYTGTYIGLMKSIISLVCRYPVLRVSAVRAGLGFGSIMAMWTSLAFHMEHAPFYAGSHVVGLLGLCGVAGVLSASFIGSYVGKIGLVRFNCIGAALMLIAWFCLSVLGDSYAGVIAGVVIIDVGLQCIQLSNQTSLFAIEPKASNRINTVFMTTYFAGGSLGTLLAGVAWSLWGWNGVVCAGVMLTLLSLLVNMKKV